MSVQNNQSVRIFQYKTYSQWGYSGTKYLVSRDIPAQNIQSVGIFQYEKFRQWGCPSTKYSISRDIPVRKISHEKFSH
jgi:uncharacterized protein YjdB